MKKLLCEVLSKSLRVTAKGKYKVYFHHNGRAQRLHLFGHEAGDPGAWVMDFWIELDQESSATWLRYALRFLDSFGGEAMTA